MSFFCAVSVILMLPQAVLTFEECAAHMDIKVEDVEKWIVRVVSSGIADCKIRQQVGIPDCLRCSVRRARAAICLDACMSDLSQDRSVTVTRCNERVFGPREWKLLEENLAVWNSSLSNMISEAFPHP
jgi:hypothetical protein